MSRFIETIAIKSGEVQNLDLHQERVNRTFKDLFPQSSPLILSQWIPQYLPDDGHKLRFTYSDQDLGIEILPHEIPKISSLRLVENDSISYAYKSEDRTTLDQCYDERQRADDIIIVKDGYLTDSWFANIALLQDGKWFTPDTPLLEGTKRASYLKSGELNLRTIRKDDLFEYSRVSLINALLDLGEIEIETESVKW